MRLLPHLVVLAVVLTAHPIAGATRQQANSAVRVGGVPLTSPIRSSGSDTSLTCFDGPLTLALNPGCFNSPGPTCESRPGHYFLQYITPSFATPHRVAAFAFISNDGETVFPRAGVILVPTLENRFPTPAELLALQVTDVPTPHDTAVVTVDLRAVDPPLIVTSGTDVVICLQFPETGSLVDVTDGPAIIVDEDAPDPDCDFFTLDGGMSYFTNCRMAGGGCPAPDPLDWGFEIVFEPVTAVNPASWSILKQLYRSEQFWKARPTLQR